MSTLFIYYLFPSSGSRTDEPEELTFHRAPLSNDQDHLIFDTQQRPSSSQQPSLDDLDVTPEKEGMILSYTGPSNLL